MKVGILTRRKSIGLKKGPKAIPPGGLRHKNDVNIKGGYNHV